MNAVKDPVCGMMVPVGSGLSTIYHGREFRFCSDLCQRSFLADPERYAASSSEVVLGSANNTRRIAYFSMEVAVGPLMPTYSGGLGVLAGDTLRSCADLKIPVVGISLLYRQGYFDQSLDEWGNQHERPVTWDPTISLRELPTTVQVIFENYPLTIRAWQFEIIGNTGFVVPLLFLDTNLPENTARDRELTSWLYGGGNRERLAQEVILGIGGIRMLQALGYTHIERFHMNEGHAALLAIELLRATNPTATLEWDFNIVRSRCVFTTHTPVPAGHDRFPYDLVKSGLGDILPLDVMKMLGGHEELNMTLLALNLSHYVNGVAKRHGQVSQEMFPGYAIASITNGVHSLTWTCESFRALYDRHIPGWFNDPFSLRYAISIPNNEIWAAHVEAKERLLHEVRTRTGIRLSHNVFTIGFARRATLYKRADLLLTDPNQLRDIAKHVGPIQLIFAGKAHPKDDPGKEMIKRVLQVAKQLENEVTILYLENYDIYLAQLLTAGVDLWLNTPLRPLEASGTSGMKAAHNGVPSLSVLDGWWIEGHIEGVTGWSIGPGPAESSQDSDVNARDSAELYQKLRWVIAPLFFHHQEQWIEVMRHTIAFNASFFNSHRMVQQYAANAYM
ncbi:MAG: alpha-glucan family phosphorylase [Nitrospira sp. BO4]|nr:alpha-glucan family phosphorylase [Nitrospira sp. BO4]